MCHLKEENGFKRQYYRAYIFSDTAIAVTGYRNKFPIEWK